MSKISLTPNASGTGTFTIASPNGNTDRTINLPDSNGTILTTATAGVPVNGPAFSAYPSAIQNLTSSTWTKLQINTEEFDTNGEFNTATYRFTPTVAGYYQVNLSVYPNSTTTFAAASIYKNGAENKNNQTSSAVGIAVSALIYLNGSTDYIEPYGFLTGTSPQMWNAPRYVFFQAFLARSAT